MPDPTQGHTARRYDKELGSLRGLVLEMGETVLSQINGAVGAMVEGGVDQARRVVDVERKIDYFELDADEAIFNLIAKRQPAAIDLRLIVGLSKVVGDLERAGDKAERIAWCAIRLLEREGATPSAKILHHVRRLHELAVQMLERALDALADSDVDAALDVFASDAGLEGELDAAMRHLMTFVFEDPALLGQVLDLAFTLRALYGIGDHAGNIAEQVIFIAKGKDVRYQNREILIEALRRRMPR